MGHSPIRIKVKGYSLRKGHWVCDIKSVPVCSGTLSLYAPVFPAFGIAGNYRKVNGYGPERVSENAESAFRFRRFSLSIFADSTFPESPMQKLSK